MKQCIAFSFLLMLLASGCSGKKDVPFEKITQANFDKVEKGMSLKEVENLMGPAIATHNLKDQIQPGDRAQIEEVWGVVPDQSVLWMVDDSGYQVLFKEDKVVAKRPITDNEISYGLLTKIPPSEKLTQKTADQLKEGMSRAQVEALLGPGQGAKKMPGTYLWQKGRQQVTIIFDDNDKVTQIIKRGF